jgi:hypothetical protein
LRRQDRASEKQPPEERLKTLFFMSFFSLSADEDGRLPDLCSSWVEIVQAVSEL